MSAPIGILGASGYIGSAFCDFFAARGIAFRAISRADIDIYHPPALLKTLQELRPSLVINAAGFTGKPNVDACEDAKAECLMANSVLPALVAHACESLNIPWGHVSSGCIYRGEREDGNGFTETDAPNFTFRQPPCSFYSGSKALGEETLEPFKRGYIWRLRMPFHHRDEPRNYLTKLMRYDTLLDVKNSLSNRDEFVRACWECWENQIPFGTYNMTQPGSITTSEIVELIRMSGRCKKEFQFFENEEHFMKAAARSPRSNCVLSCEKILQSDIRLTEVHELVERCLKNWEPTK